jgi:hypothetical protein
MVDELQQVAKQHPSSKSSRIESSQLALTTWTGQVAYQHNTSFYFFQQRIKSSAKNHNL